MVIDSHTHIFPDPVAQKAIPELAALIKARPAMDGTVNGLLESMENGDIGISIVLPIVTHPHQFDSILRFAVHLNETYSAGRRRIHSLASVHPLEPAFAEQLRLIRREGFTGIKIHPPYQGVELNDIRYKRIIEKASELGLSVTTHAGFDVYCPHHNYCSVDMILEVLHDVAPPALVAAHLGNNSYYDEVEKKLCGQNLYFDTAYSILHISETQLAGIIRQHGADKVLFATDVPWADQKASVERLRNLPGLSPEEKERLLFRNAASLYHLDTGNASEAGEPA